MLPKAIFLALWKWTGVRCLGPYHSRLYSGGRAHHPRGRAHLEWREARRARTATSVSRNSKTSTNAAESPFRPTAPGSLAIPSRPRLKQLWTESKSNWRRFWEQVAGSLACFSEEMLEAYRKPRVS